MSICQGFFGKGSGNDTDCVCELQSWHKQKHPALSQPTAQQKMKKTYTTETKLKACSKTVMIVSVLTGKLKTLQTLGDYTLSQIGGLGQHSVCVHISFVR